MSDYKISVEVKTFADGKVNLLFSCNGGKFGTDEILDEYDLTAEELLNILQANGDEQSTDPALHKHIVSNNEVAVCEYAKNTQGDKVAKSCNKCTLCND